MCTTDAVRAAAAAAPSPVQLRSYVIGYRNMHRTSAGAVSIARGTGGVRFQVCVSDRFDTTPAQRAPMTMMMMMLLLTVGNALDYHLTKHRDFTFGSGGCICFFCIAGACTD